MKRAIISILIFTSLSAFAQNVTKEDLEKETKPLTEKVKTLQSEKGKLKIDIKKLNSKLSNTNARIYNLQKQIETNNRVLTQTNNELRIKIQQTGKTSEEKITAAIKSLSENSLYGILCVLFTLLISGLIYWVLTNRYKTDKSNIESQIENAKNALLTEGIQLNTKLVNILETQLNLIQEEEKSKNIAEVDHSLPLKVADEITRINAYSNTLDPNSQDAKALKSSIKRLINTFKAANYDIVDLLGQRYDDGLKVIVVNAILDEKLKPGEEVISRIIKPLVKFNGVQIQAAQVDISVGK
jgi:L-cystine uptake protein TcyP (sodium:dicarboxylate symporter family)